jgi:hypothetical protein
MGLTTKRASLRAVVSMKTNEEYEKKLETFIQDQLKQLPDREAPASLIPRVLAAIEARRHLPWWHHPLFAWPLPVQRACVAVLAMLPVVAVWFGNALAVELYRRMPESPIGAWWQSIRTSAETLAPLGNAVSLVVQSLGQPWVLGAAALIGVMYLVCIGVGTACVRVASHKW